MGNTFPIHDIEISVIVPCYNEEGNILPLCRRIQEVLSPLHLGFELICVDDGSTDRTAEAIRRAQDQFAFLRGAYHERNGGIAKGWHTGFEKSRGRYVVTMDADLQYRPEDIVTLYERIKQGDIDLVQGWRKGQPDRGPLRKVLSSGLSLLLNVAFGTRLKDNKSGFILYRREVFGDLVQYRRKFKLFQHFVTVAAHARGYRIVQEPVRFDRRTWGESFIHSPFRFSAEVMFEFGKAMYEFRLKGPPSKREG